MSAASRAKKLNSKADVVVLEETSMVSHAPCGIPYYVGGYFSDEKLFSAYNASQFEKLKGARVKVSTKVVEVRDGELVVDEGGQRGIVEYDKLIIATGARPRLPDIPINGDVLTVHHPANATAVKQRLWSARDIIIVGGGFLSIEMAEALVGLGKRVTIIARSDHLLSRVLDSDMSKIVENKLRESVNLVLGEEAISIGLDINGRMAVETSKGKYAGDSVVLATGIRPNSELAVGAGLSVGRSGGIIVDDHMRTSKPDIYAAGDVVETINAVTGDRTIAPFGPIANKMGYVAGVNAAGGDMAFPGVVLTSITRFFDLEIGSTGIKESDAVRLGFNPRTSIIKARTRSRYYPGGGLTWIKLVSDYGGKLIGGQVVGEEEVLARINVIAMAVQRGLTIRDLFFAELGYLPPLSTAWDPLIIAARRLMPEG